MSIETSSSQSWQAYRQIAQAKAIKERRTARFWAKVQLWSLATILVAICSMTIR